MLRILLLGLQEGGIYPELEESLKQGLNMLDLHLIQLGKQWMKIPEDGLEIQLLGITFHSQSMKPSKFMPSFCLPIS